MNAFHDSVLVTQLKNGEGNAFDQLFNKYRIRLIKHASRILTSKADAEDVVQDAFLKAFRGISSFKEESTFFTWIFKITLNCAYASRRLSGHDVSISWHEDWEHAESTMICVDNPADECQKMQLLSELDRRLDDMAEIFAETFILRELDGLSYEDIAEATHCSVGTVRSRLFRARHLVNAVLTNL